MKLRRQSQSGMSLISVVVAAGLAAVVVTMMSTFMGRQMNAQRHIEDRADMTQIRHTLLKTMDCAATLAAVSNPSDCGPNRFLRLKSPSSDLTGALQTSGNFAGAGKIFDNWYIKARCSANPPTLKVHIAKEGAPGQFANDRLLNHPLSFAYPKHEIFSENKPMCVMEVQRAIQGNPLPSNPNVPSVPVPTNQRPPHPTPNMTMSGYECEDIDSESDARQFFGIFSCPTGQAIKYGGVYCPYPGQVIYSFPLDAKTWAGGCCGARGAVTGACE